MIKEWIFNIVLIAMVGVLLDIVLPSGNLKKYSRFITGLFTIIVILNPILSMFDQLPQLEKNIASNIYAMDMKSFEYQSKVVAETQQHQLKELFEKNIENHVYREVKKITGYSDVRVQVELDQIDNTQDMGRVEEIYLEIGGREKQVKAIKPVDIHVSTSGNKVQEHTAISDTARREQEKIIDHISDIYEIDPSRIYITWTGKAS